MDKSRVLYIIQVFCCVVDLEFGMCCFKYMHGFLIFGCCHAYFRSWFARYDPMCMHTWQLLIFFWNDHLHKKKNMQIWQWHDYMHIYSCAYSMCIHACVGVCWPPEDPEFLALQRILDPTIQARCHGISACAYGWSKLKYELILTCCMHTCLYLFMCMVGI